jgi:quercetin dioxygenase-like cupin family protein
MCVQWLWMSLLLVSLSGCVSLWVRTTTGQELILPDDLIRWLSTHPLAPDENIRIDELKRTEEFSTHLVQIRDQESLHVHQRHDLKAILHSGYGVLQVGSQQRALSPGETIAIPRGTPHAFVNHSPKPAVAMVMFSPPFDGQDTLPVSE